MIKIENGTISIKGSGQELLNDTLSLVYSIRRTMIQGEHVEFVEQLDKYILSILAETFDDNIACFEKFDNKEDNARFVKEYEARKKSSTAESIMRDIWKD